MIKGLLKILKKGENKAHSYKEDNSPPHVSRIGEHVEKIIEVHYLNCGTPKVESGRLKCFPNREFFYIGDNIGQHIIYWDRTENDGRRDFVKLIRDEHGNIIYENSSHEFDYSAVKKREETASKI